MELYTIVVNETGHPYWFARAFVALRNNDWGPSPTLGMVKVPEMFLTFKEAQDVIDEYNCYGVSMRVATFTQKTFTQKQMST